MHALNQLAGSLLAVGPADAGKVAPMTPGRIAMYVVVTVVSIALCYGVIKLIDRVESRGKGSFPTRVVLAVLGLGLLGLGAWLGLGWAPPDREMGDVQRIMYAHVPSVWMALIGLVLNFVASVVYLFKNSWKTDALAEASAEAGVVIGANGVLLGAIWARPTWGVWWTWDPRLTTAAIMLIAYAGYLALRKFIEDPERRAMWSAVYAIFAAIDLPILWFSVRWWRSIHQLQSAPSTVDPQMVIPLRVNAFAFLFITIVFIWQRYRISLRTREEEVALPSELPPDSVPSAHGTPHPGATP